MNNATDLQLSSVGMADSHFSNSSNYTSSTSLKADVVHQPPDTAKAHRGCQGKLPTLLATTSQSSQTSFRRSRIIRARPLGESTELQSSDDDSEDEVKGTTCIGTRRSTCSDGVARGWSLFVDAASRFIQKTPSDLDGDLEPGTDGNNINVGSDGGGGGGGGAGGGGSSAACATSDPDRVSFTGGLRRLLLVAFWDILHPESKFRVGWDALVISCLMYVAFVTTYLLSFEFHRNERITFFVVCDLVINSVFLIDIPFNFRTALRRGDDAVRRRQVITCRRTIALNYLSGWLVVDLVAALPWTYITRSLASYMQLLKLLRLVRLLRLLQMSRSMQRNRLYMNMEHSQGAAVARVVSYVMGAVLVVHMSASAWFFVAVMQSKDLEGTWAEAAGLQDATAFERYLTSLYFVVITFTTVGYGDVYPVTTAERFMTCVGMLVGVVTLGYIISTANTIAGKADKYELARSELLDRVESFLEAQPLTTGLATRIKNYFEYVARRRFNDRDDQQLVASLPSDLRRAVLRAMHSKLVKQVPFLRAAAAHHEALVLEITAALKLEFYTKGEVVVSEGGWDSELYFVTEGTLQVRQYTADWGVGPAATAGGLRGPTSPTDTNGDAGLRLAAAAVSDAMPPPQAGIVAVRGSVAAAAATSAATTAGDGDGGSDIGDEVAPGNVTAGCSFRSRGGGGGEVEGNPRRSPTNFSMVRKWLATAVGGVTQAQPSPGDVVLKLYGENAVSAHTSNRDDGARGEQLATAAASPPPPTPPLLQVKLGAAPTDGRDQRFVRGSGSGFELGSVPPCSSGRDPGIHIGASSGVGGGGVGGVSVSGHVVGGGSFAAEELQPVMSPMQQGLWKSRSLYDSNLRYRRLKELKKGHYFGEYGCLTGCPRTATVVAVQMCEVYCLKRSDLKAAMSKWPGLEAAWKRCEEYGMRERDRLRLCLQANHTQRSLALIAVEDPYDNRPHDRATNAVVNSEKRYQDFLGHFGGAAGVIAAAPGRGTAAAESVAAVMQRDGIRSEPVSV
ncbi:hypothetical protein VaNZ11_006304 [Volvox africanus]|uniref:Cyclic nucleotide-binding domain-containing protein n=1 Tax=Volvox africanus TaxID=51714 RepID=A0ABQ5S208_9CHLO|nr:hypothetical protein VaNZ11_006304 [Volvox africanus]